MAPKKNRARHAGPTTVGHKRKRALEHDDADIAPGHSKKTQAAKRSRSKLSSIEETSKTDFPVPKTRRSPDLGKRESVQHVAPLDIFVFGEGAVGELGLGSKTVDDELPMEVMWPRLNKLLSSSDVGVVQIACGGMHAVALTRDNKILTWGVNDLGALGRTTDAEEDDDDLLNPAESTPGPVNTSDLDHDIRWAQVAASDNATFALTHDGKVYGWGTFRVCLARCQRKKRRKIGQVILTGII